MSDATTTQDEPTAEVVHERPFLVTWDDETFTWDCSCGHRNVEKLPEGGMAEATPGTCQAA